MVYGITDLTTFVLGTIVIVLLPGPNSLYVMTVASQQGVGAGYRGAGKGRVSRNSGPSAMRVIGPRSASS